jgi:hypothetical protein
MSTPSPKSRDRKQSSSPEIPRELPTPTYSYQKEDHRSFNTSTGGKRPSEDQGHLDLSLADVQLKF